MTSIEKPLVRAHVVLKGIGGSLMQRAPVSAANVQQFAATKEVQQRVRDALRKLGFSVGRISAFSITVQGEPDLFETVFKAHIGRSKRDETSPATSIGAGRPPFPAEGYYWIDTPLIPDELSAVVDSVVFPEPIELH